MDTSDDPERQHALQEYKRKLIESREWEAKLKALRLEIKGLQKDYDTSEDNIKALQSVGQIIGEVLKQLDEERCTFPPKCAQKRVRLDASGTSALTRVFSSNYSYRQSFLWPALCGWMPFQGRKAETEARRSGCA